MEFSSLWYFSFWSVISQIFITIGLNALHKAVNETIFLWFMFFIICSVCLSCSYAFLFCPSLEQALFLNVNVEDFLIEVVLRHLVTLLPISVIGILLMLGNTYSLMVFLTCLLASVLPLSVSMNSRSRFVLKGLVSPFILYPSHTLCWVFFYLLLCVAPVSLIDYDFETNQIVFTINMNFLSTIVKMFCGCSIMAVVSISTYICSLTWFRKKLVFSPTLVYIHSKIKFINIILGILAYIMVQHIILGKSVFLMLALLSFTITWVGIVAIAHPPTDFGVFTFLVGASLDCTMSIFGLRHPTWIVSGVCILLIYLYRKLDSVLLRYSGVRGGTLRDYWTCLELHKHLRLLVGVTDITISGGIYVDEHTCHIQMSPTTCLKIKKGNITEWFVDGATYAIVNPANERMLGGGGCDEAIHKAAGEELLIECYQVPEVRSGVRCPAGEARITRGYKLPVAHVIHTDGPMYYTERRPEGLLRNAYKNSLNIAKANNIKYIAFPAISCGLHGFPIDEAAVVALSTVKEHANELKEACFYSQASFLPSSFELYYPLARTSSNRLKVHFVLSDNKYKIWSEKALKLLNPHT